MTKKKLMFRLPEIIQNVERELTEREKFQVEKTIAAEEKANLPLKKIGKYPYVMILSRNCNQYLYIY
jgi:hypothetical protein